MKFIIKKLICQEIFFVIIVTLMDEISYEKLLFAENYKNLTAIATPTITPTNIIQAAILIMISMP
jgi:hypothetical protein